MVLQWLEQQRNTKKTSCNAVRHFVDYELRSRSIQKWDKNGLQHYLALLKTNKYNTKRYIIIEFNFFARIEHIQTNIFFRPNAGRNPFFPKLEEELKTQIDKRVEKGLLRDRQWLRRTALNE